MVFRSVDYHCNMEMMTTHEMHHSYIWLSYVYSYLTCPIHLNASCFICNMSPLEGVKQRYLDQWLVSPSSMMPNCEAGLVLSGAQGLVLSRAQGLLLLRPRALCCQGPRALCCRGPGPCAVKGPRPCAVEAQGLVPSRAQSPCLSKRFCFRHCSACHGSFTAVLLHRMGTSQRRGSETLSMQLWQTTSATS